MNEIALLRRLDGNDRIIKLVESEVRGGSKGHLMLVSVLPVPLLDEKCEAEAFW